MSTPSNALPHKLRLRQSYRVWFDYLNYAKSRGFKVAKDYEEWGDTSTTFTKWWDSVGASLSNTVANNVDLANTENRNNDNYYLFAIPKHLSARQVREQSEALIKALQAEHGKPTLQTKWRLSSDVTPKLEHYKSYLRAVQCRDELKDRKISEGLEDTKVEFVEVLAALRSLYQLKFRKYKEHADLLPHRLTHGDGGHETDPNKIIVSDHTDPRVATQAINGVREYMIKGDSTLENVIKGQFP